MLTSLCQTVIRQNKQPCGEHSVFGVFNRQIFPSGDGADQNGAKVRVNIGQDTSQDKCYFL